MFLPILLLVVATVVALWTLAAVGTLLFTLIPWAIMGLLTGWIASRITGARLSTGWTILTGIAGSWLGGALFAALHIHAYGLMGPLLHLVSSVLGASILITLARVMARPSLTGAAHPRFGRT